MKRPRCVVRWQSLWIKIGRDFSHRGRASRDFCSALASNKWVGRISIDRRRLSVGLVSSVGWSPGILTVHSACRWCSVRLRLSEVGALAHGQPLVFRSVVSSSRWCRTGYRHFWNASRGCWLRRPYLFSVDRRCCLSCRRVYDFAAAGEEFNSCRDQAIGGVV